MVLPIIGLWFVYIRPPGLITPPPLRFETIAPLMARTLALAACVSTVSLVIGTWLAWALERSQFIGRTVLSVLCVLPLATPSYIIAAIVREEMAPGGSIGSLLATTGQFTGFWPAVLVLSVSCTPYVVVLMTAAFARCPIAEEEAARILGASGWRQFQTVLLPGFDPPYLFHWSSSVCTW